MIFSTSSWLLPEVEFQRRTVIAMAGMKKWRKKNNDLQNTTQKIKDREPWIPLKIVGEIRSSVRVKQFLLHMWHPSCYSCYKSGDKLCMRKNRIVITTNGKYPRSQLWDRYDYQCHGNRKYVDVICLYIIVEWFKFTILTKID